MADIQIIIENKAQLFDKFIALHGSPSPALNTPCGFPFPDMGTN